MSRQAAEFLMCFSLRMLDDEPYGTLFLSSSLDVVKAWIRVSAAGKVSEGQRRAMRGKRGGPGDAVKYGGQTVMFLQAQRGRLFIRPMTHFMVACTLAVYDYIIGGNSSSQQRSACIIITY